MCISYKDDGEIIVQLELVAESNTVLIKYCDSDYTRYFQHQFIKTFNRVHARDSDRTGAARSKTPYDNYAWKPRIGTYDIKESVPDKILHTKKKLQALTAKKKQSIRRMPR
eukprot:12410282-Karenia_brevis.AAC.1